MGLRRVRDMGSRERCVKKARKRHAVREMKLGTSELPCRVYWVTIFPRFILTILSGAFVTFLSDGKRSWRGDALGVGIGYFVV